MTDDAPTPKLAFIDCETTGLDPRTHQLWELAVIVREPGEADVEHVWQIRPNLQRADPVALKKNRFHERFSVGDRWNAKHFYEDGGQVHSNTSEALFDMQEVLRDTYLVGAVPSFDQAMMTAFFQAFCRKIPWHYRLVCVENLVAGALRLPVPPGLKDAADAMGVKYDPAELHTALADARLARDVYDAVMGGGAR